MNAVVAMGIAVLFAVLPAGAGDGMEILRRFTMTFDVRRRALYLEPNVYFRDAVPSPPPSL